MRHLSLFTGIAGFELAARMVWGAEHELVACCEIDEFCQKIIRKHFGNVPICEDIRKLSYGWIDTNAKSDRLQRRGMAQTGQINLSAGDCSGGTEIDLLTGGFPCQPFSVAGQRRGTDDDRYLWPEMLRIIREFKPRWVIGENVAGIKTMAQSVRNIEVESRTITRFGESDHYEAVLSREELMLLDAICESLEKEGYEV